jgi:hypothetical protein
MIHYSINNSINHHNNIYNNVKSIVVALQPASQRMAESGQMTQKTGTVESNVIYWQEGRGKHFPFTHLYCIVVYWFRWSLATFWSGIHPSTINLCYLGVSEDLKHHYQGTCQHSCVSPVEWEVSCIIDYQVCTRAATAVWIKSNTSLYFIKYTVTCRAIVKLSLLTISL